MISSDTPDWIGRALEDGRYQVTAKIGSGGMGLVYRARDTKLDTTVVVKALRRSLMEDTAAAVRFRREIRALVQLAHPHIVSVQDVGEHDGLPFLVMQYLPGGSLHDRMRAPDGRAVPVPASRLHGWLPDVADALDSMHRQGYLHRDVKPHNILFDADGKAYLSDFGLVRALDGINPSGGLTNTGQLLGTLHYLAPEICQEKAYDGRVDQYALAATTYHYLCGRPPFEGPVAVLLTCHLTKPPPPLREFVPGLPEAVERAVLRGLEKSPDDRFPDCVSFAAAVLAGAPPEGADGGSVTRVQCPACKRTLRLRGGAAGKRAKCPACQAAFRLPGHDATPTPTPVTARLTPPPARAPRRPPGAAPEPLLTNSAGIELVLVPAGRFPMGSPEEEGGEPSERPRREVEVRRPFYLGRFPVTQDEYERVMGTNPSWFRAGGRGAGARDGVEDTTRFPVESVSWHDAREFCRRLSRSEGREYRLPTEAEWEYACRAGTETAFCFGDGLTSAEANFDGSYPYGGADRGPFLARPAPVGAFPANAWGLHDLHGNVWEWCADGYDENYYENGPAQDPPGPAEAAEGRRVVRGGSWNDGGRDCRSANRNAVDPDTRGNDIGFRIVLVLN